MTDSFIEFLYPHFTPKLFEAIVFKYQLGVLKRWEIVPGGWSNVNILLETSLGRYILRIYRETKKKDDLLFEIDLINKLWAKKIPVATAIKNTNNNYFLKQKLGSRILLLAVFNYIEGERKVILLPKELEAAGSMLSQIHTIVGVIKPNFKRETWDFEKRFNEVKGKILKRTRQKTWNFEDVVGKEKFLEKVTVDLHNPNFGKIAKQLEKLPNIILHGDFHAENLRFKNGQIVGVFDFDQAFFGPRVVDLAICCANLRIQHGQDNKITAETIQQLIVLGYSKKLTLSKIEQNILAGLVKFWIISQFIWVLAPITSIAQLSFYKQVFASLWKVYTK